MRTFTKIASVLALPILAACVTTSAPKKAYDGPEVDVGNLSLIGCSMAVSIKSIDGNESYNGRKFKCDHYVKPGEHTVSYSLSQSSAKVGYGYAYKDEGRTIKINTKAGHRYVLFGVFDEFGDNTWKFHVMLKDANGEPLSMDVDYTVVE